MGLNMQRTRLADALISAVAEMPVGAVVSIPNDALTDAFPSPEGVQGSLVKLLTQVPDAPWHYRYPSPDSSRETSIERIKPDGSRRFVAPEEAEGFFRLGEIYLRRA